ncbi:MAG: hypothetical protein HOP17_12945 [Acidobacteria bacterium]|nr:hypothetical protein [Acidobacteriota bacterium]
MFTTTAIYQVNWASGLRSAALSFFVTLVLAVAAAAQTPVQTAVNTTDVESDQTTTAAKVAAVLPGLTNYKGIMIGSTADEVREKLGKAKIDDKDGFYYRFDDSEFAQIRLDKNSKVKLISITHSSESENVPAYTDIFGAGATPAAKPDGSVYKFVRYPQAGYWVAYSRTAGNDPSVTVTMQKLQSLK